MATPEEYAAWIVANKDKKGTAEFDKVSKAYQISKQSRPIDTETVNTDIKSPMAWADVGKQAISNIPKSGAEFGSSILEAVSHPIDTTKNVYKVASGAAQKLIPGEQENEKYASAVGDFFSDRYGGTENIKQTIASDPVGFLADASTLLTGGGAAAARLPGVAGKVGAVVKNAGKVIDPISLTAKAVTPVLKGAGKVASEVIGGLGTHTGGESIRTAAKAGFKGGKTADDFREALRGSSDAEDVVSDVKSALSGIRTVRGEKYRQGMNATMGAVSPNGERIGSKILNFGPIDKALANIAEIGTYKGKVINRSTAETLKKITDVVDEWRAASPADFHTPEGLDALKRVIGDIRESTEYGSPSRLMAGQVYNAVKQQIVAQSPEYAKTMKSYDDASKLIKEIEKSLSLGEKASSDTALRKLQSVMRNNVNTNYGKRLELVEKLKEAGASTVMEKLAGQSLNKWTPRGLGNATALGTGGLGYLIGGPQVAIPMLAAQSPRLMGEAAYYGGRGAGIARDVAKKIPASAPPIAFQAGRTKEIIDRIYGNQKP